MAKIASVPHGRQNRYTRAEQLQVVAILKEFGGVNDLSFDAVRTVFPAVGFSTCWRWWAELKDSVEIEHVAKAIEVRAELQADESEQKLLLDIYKLALERMSNAEYVSQSPLSSVVKMAEFTEEKIRDRLGLTTEMITAVMRLNHVCNRMDYDPVDTVNAIADQMEEVERSLPHKANAIQQAIVKKGRGRVRGPYNKKPKVG